MFDKAAEKGIDRYLDEIIIRPNEYWGIGHSLLSNDGLI